MPKTYTPNEYPDRNLSPLELTREMIEFYDFKNKPESYKKFVELLCTPFLLDFFRIDDRVP